jgi:hypothetical protein
MTKSLFIFPEPKIHYRAFSPQNYLLPRPTLLGLDKGRYPWYSNSYASQIWDILAVPPANPVGPFRLWRETARSDTRAGYAG